VNVLSEADRLLGPPAEQGDMSMAAMIDASDEPRASVCCLVESMRDLGWVEPGGRRGQYRLGIKIFRRSWRRTSECSS